MKREMLIGFSAIILIALLSHHAWAQLPIGYGIKGGVNFSSIRTDAKGLDLSSRSGIVVGGFLKLDIPGPLAIQPEILFTQKGSKTDTAMAGAGNTGASDLKVKISYLEIPVLIKYDIALTGPVSPGLFFGPALSYKLSEDFPSAAIGGDITNEDVVKNTDLSLVIGGGLGFNLVVTEITVDARYTLGLTNIVDTGKLQATDVDYKNGTFSLMVGITL